MTLRAGRLVVALCATLAVLACEVDRERPAPPRLALTMDQDSVGSPDNLTGSIRADDQDGIDSIWLSVDSAVPPLGADGLLESTFTARFQAAVRAGHVAGDRVSVRLTGRDVSGYVSTLDTFVAVRVP